MHRHSPVASTFVVVTVVLSESLVARWQGFAADSLTRPPRSHPTARVKQAPDGRLFKHLVD